MSSKQYISNGSLGRSFIIQASQSITAVLRRVSAYLCIISLSIIMSSRDQAFREGDVQEGCIVKTEDSVMVAHDTTSNKDCVFRDAAAIAIDLSKLGSVSGKKYGEPLGDPICVCGFKKALSVGQLIDFGDPARRVKDLF